MYSKHIPTNAEHVSSELKAACISDEEIAEYLSGMHRYELRQLLCDVVGVSHHTPKDELMKLLSEKI